MHVEEALYAHLVAATGLAALVGDRVYPVALPLGVTLPAVTYVRSGGSPLRTHDGGRLVRPRYRVVAWAESYAAARAVAEQVRIALDGFVGTLGGTLPATVLAETADEWRDVETGWLAAAVEAIVWYRE